MDLSHCTTCEGTHPPPLDDGCPFSPQGHPPSRVTRQTIGSPSLSHHLPPSGTKAFAPPQFAVPSNSIGQEQLLKAGLDPKLLQQATDPAAALRAYVQSSKKANLLLRGVELADPATPGGLHQNPPLTAQWHHKKVWLPKTGH